MDENDRMKLPKVLLWYRNNDLVLRLGLDLAFK